MVSGAEYLGDADTLLTLSCSALPHGHSVAGRGEISMWTPVSMLHFTLTLQSRFSSCCWVGPCQGLAQVQHIVAGADLYYRTVSISVLM